MASFLRSFTTSASAAKTPLSVLNYRTFLDLRSPFRVLLTRRLFSLFPPCPLACIRACKLRRGSGRTCLCVTFFSFPLGIPNADEQPVPFVSWLFSVTVSVSVHDHTTSTPITAPPPYVRVHSSTSPSTRNRQAESCFACSMTWCRARRRTFASSRRVSTASGMQAAGSIGSSPTCVTVTPYSFFLTDPRVACI